MDKGSEAQNENEVQIRWRWYIKQTVHSPRLVQQAGPFGFSLNALQNQMTPKYVCDDISSNYLY